MSFISRCCSSCCQLFCLGQEPDPSDTYHADLPQNPIQRDPTEELTASTAAVAAVALANASAAGASAEPQLPIAPRVPPPMSARPKFHANSLPPPRLARPKLSSEDQAICDEYRNLIDMKRPVPRPLDKSDLPTQLAAKDMDKISLCNTHYIASSKWMSLVDTDKSFWKLVFLNRPCILINLDKHTNDYFPKEVGESIRTRDTTGLSVTCLNKENLGNALTKRVFEVAMQSDTFRIVHLHYEGWPDMDVPEQNSFAGLLNAVNTECPASTPENRIFVHCAGGIGRTGTFIAAHAAQHLPVEYQTQNPFPDLIMLMREQRLKRMVETSEQYMLLRKWWQKKA